MCPFCRQADCAHLVLRYRDWQQLDWLYARQELGTDIYGADAGRAVGTEIIAALRAHCMIAPGAVYATAEGRERARREVAEIVRRHVAGPHTLR